MSKKLIKVGHKVVVILDDGTYLERDNIQDDDFKTLRETDDEDIIAAIMTPQTANERKRIKNEISKIKQILERVSKSHILSFKDESVYWKDISAFSLPIDLVEKILDAEDTSNKLLLETYSNFWTLMSLNPDEQCRKNLFWFLKKWGMQIARCGFFVAYRNVCTTNKREGDKPIYTDQYTHTFHIKIGEMVIMPRKDCNSDSNISCSKGLHLGGCKWLEQNYFGNTGMVCLCNPAEVTAVPHVDNYGKLRTCAYLPIALAHFDESKHVIPYNKDDGFDCTYVTKVIYEGLMGTTEDSPYRIEIPKVPEINRENITDRILSIAKECIVNRNIL